MGDVTISVEVRSNVKPDITVTNEDENTEDTKLHKIVVKRAIDQVESQNKRKRKPNMINKSLIGKKFHHLTILDLLPSQYKEDRAKGIYTDTSNFTSYELSQYHSTRCVVACDCGSPAFVTTASNVVNGLKRVCSGRKCIHSKLGSPHHMKYDE